MKFLQRTIPIIFGIIFTYILVLLMFFSNINYNGKVNYLLPNILVVFFIIIVFLIYYKCKSKKDITDKSYRITLLIICAITLIAELIIIRCCFFRTDWDVEVVEYSVKYFMSNGILPEPSYITRYPNNIMITFLMVLIKSIPIPVVGGTTVMLLVVNALLVNLAGVFCSKTIKNITNNNKLALASFLITVPLIMLSPWIIIVYTDTFAILFPILMIYLYTKKKKRIIDFFLIPFLGFFGMYIKPTIIIVLIAILIVEIFTRGIFTKNIKKLSIYILLLVLAILFPILINMEAKSYLKFEPVKGVYEFNSLHYLAMGQNDETDGAYNNDDWEYSKKHGMKNNFNRFKDRVTKRTFTEQVHFLSKKTLVNFNNGSFNWSGEGKFYREVPAPKDDFSKALRSYYYAHSKYYKCFLQITQYIWLFVLFFIPFIIKKENSKEELVLMLSIIGITLFLTIFEARGRYLYCYSPIFVVTAILGISHLKQIIYNIKKKSKKKKAK